MPRWKALPDELDPQIREFTSQLRRLVDRSGLSVASVADRTGYSKTSWERYLNGRLLAPKGAIVALAEVTKTNPVHLTTMWELAERAWSRSEMRHDMTMEAIRISQARAALSELAAPPSGGGGRRGGGARTGVAGPAGVSPSVPPQPTATDVRDASGSGNSWGVADRSAGRPGAYGPGAPAAGGYGPPPADPSGPGGGPGRPEGKRRTAMFLVGALGALVVVAAGLYVTETQGDTTKAKPSPSPTVTKEAQLPPGVKCSGESCDGKDAEVMGCSGDLVTTAGTATVGATTVEIRYSEVCGAAWGRITQATQGDTVEITSGAYQQTDSVDAPGDTVTYTMMVPVAAATEAKACAVLAATGEKGCTE
ncbi:MULTISPECIES: helix-turn-helix domain-containing protein [unclassified Streptomyces]|uniref:helix-turn-helix domain-containing protein n=2 Tax=Streptomyces TaxID=1883 RepID=UPI001F53BD16|nr:XRE family transcriptional regulator [Streptomyces sp. DH-12]